MMPLFSILIPTFNRREKLSIVLDTIQKQPRIQEGEVIVGIDGSEDGTEEMIGRIIRTVRNVRSFKIEHSGRAVIRNELLKRATGDLIIFIQDDIIVSPEWLDTHLHMQERLTSNQKLVTREPNYALIGHITWYPKFPITPYMRWLEHGGHLLDFDNLRDGDETDFWHCYMGNISFPRALVEGLSFDESLKTYGWEDMVFGYEFAKRGHKIFYSKKALAWHWDEYREEDLPEYMKRLAASAKIVAAKYPDLGVIPSWWKREIFYVMIAVGSIFWPILPQTWKWYLSMKREFLWVL